MKKIFILLLYAILVDIAFSKELISCKDELCSKVLNYRENYYDEEKSIEDLLEYFVPELRIIYNKEKSNKFRFFSTDLRLAIDVPAIIGVISSIDFFECKKNSFDLLEISPYFDLPRKCIKMVGSHRADKIYDEAPKVVITKLVFFKIKDDWKIGLFENNIDGVAFEQVINN